MKAGFPQTCKGKGEKLWTGKVREFYCPTKSYGKVLELFSNCWWEP